SAAYRGGAGEGGGAQPLIDLVPHGLPKRSIVARLSSSHCSMSNVNLVVPSVTSSPGASRERSILRSFTLTPLVEPRSTICQSPFEARRSSAWRRETFGSAITQSASRE